MPTTFAPATPSDIPALRALAQAIWPDAFAGIISPAQIAHMLGRMYAEEVIAQELAQGVMWELIRRDGADCGYCSYSRYDAAAVKLHKLYLLPAARGAGLAAIALERVVAYARRSGRQRVFLTVNRANARAIAAYRKAGFAIESSQRFDIGGGFVMDDHVMGRSAV